MNDAKYIGLDVHQATISAAVLDSAGKLLMESIVETKAATILQFVHGVRGSVHVTLEEGNCAAPCVTDNSYVPRRLTFYGLGFETDAGCALAYQEQQVNLISHRPAAFGIPAG